MPTLHLLVGLPGAGKMTFARKLERDRPALCLTPDEWMKPLFGVDDIDGKRGLLERELLWSVARRTLELGTDVVLDYGLWTPQERGLYRQRALELGAGVQLHVLDLPLDELWRRLERRNASGEHPFQVSREQLLAWDGWFQRPGAEELADFGVTAGAAG
ncbi:AAA family ATPase [Deinococcus sp. Marseille-Q6407]|uniref:AAA family ATPase n=1 Tax=Deinococcus sp. Marseille-Q6407 TaxID=2969223 RepID=UPI0021C235BC|nr:AAA family ATPase [Deinococcus sp. Marseille-Q6407]